MALQLMDSMSAAGVIAVSALIVAATGQTSVPILSSVHDTISIDARVIEYPLPGALLVDGRPVPAPVEVSSVASFRIMKSQVSLADYGLCVAAGACKAADAAMSGADQRNLPATGVSFLDAEAYASWYSIATGEMWRLPSDVELLSAAAERFVYDPSLRDADDPAPSSLPQPRGSYGANSLGVEDFAGNVWEWTSSCFDRGTISPLDGTVQDKTTDCDVHVLEGRHRVYLPNGTRSAKSVCCGDAAAPDHLGFRLIRGEPSFLASLSAAIGRVVGAIFPIAG